MGKIDKDFVKKSFNSSAKTYDQYADLQKSTVTELLGLFNPDDFSIHRALDIGTGTGNLTEGLIQRFPAAKVFGCDLAFSMLLQAQKKTGGNGIFSAADAEFLPYKNNSFGLVLSSFTFQWLNDREKALKEINRVLTPGGTFSFSFFGSETFHELKTAYQKACINTGYFDGEALEITVSRDNIIDSLSACGFGPSSVRSYTVVEGYDTVPDVLKMIRGMGARNASSRRSRSLGVRRIWKEMIRIYEQEFAVRGRIPATFEIIAGRAKAP